MNTFLATTYSSKVVIYERSAFIRFAAGCAGALVAWLWVMTHVRKVVGSNAGTINRMDILSH